MVRALLRTVGALVLLAAASGAGAQSLPRSVTDIVHTLFRAETSEAPYYFGALGRSNVSTVVVNYNASVQIQADRTKFLNNLLIVWYQRYRIKMNRTSICDPVEASLGVCSYKPVTGLTYVSYTGTGYWYAGSEEQTFVTWKGPSPGSHTRWGACNIAYGCTGWQQPLEPWPIATQPIFPLHDFMNSSGPNSTHGPMVVMTAQQYRDIVIKYALAGFNLWITEDQPNIDDLEAAGVVVAGVAPDFDVPPGDGFNDDGTPKAPTTPSPTDPPSEPPAPEPTPNDGETNCSILDIPCNLRKLFIPSPDFFKNLFSVQNVTQSLELPFVISDTWTFTLMGQTQTLNWADFMLPPEAVTVIKGLMWFGVFFWLLDFFGIPNPYGNARGSEQLTRDTKHAVVRWNASWARRNKKP